MRIYTLILIMASLLMNISSAVTFSPNDIQWGDNTSATLSRGGVYESEGYIIKAKQFTSAVQGYKNLKGEILPETPVEPMVYLEIYKNETLLKELVMDLKSDTYIDPDYEMKLSLSSITNRSAKEWVFEYYNPSATITLQKRAKPKLEVTIKTDKTEYISYSDTVIKANISVKNTGKAFVKNVDLVVNINELKLQGGDTSQLRQYYYKLEKDDVKGIEVILIVPDIINNKTYNISAEVKGFDVKDLIYSDNKSETITVKTKNYFTVSKAIKDRIYLNDNAIVTLRVTNGGRFDAYNIHINDTIGDYFELKSDTPLEWDIPILKSGQDWTWSYRVKPIETNIDGHTIPATKADFTVNNIQYSSSSTPPKVVVNGPKLILNKSVDKLIANLSDDVTVTVTVNNVGNIDSKTEVTDTLPDDISLVSGYMSYENFSEKNKPWKFSYVIRMKNEVGELKLPPVYANYTDVIYRGTTRAVKSSDEVIIKVIDPSKVTSNNIETAQGSSSESSSTSQDGTNSIPGGTNVGGNSKSSNEPTPTPITSGFETVFGIIAVLLSVLYIMKRK